MFSFPIFESNVIHPPDKNSAQGILWLDNKKELTTTRFPSTTFLFMIVSLPSHFCTCFSEPFSKVMTFCWRKKMCGLLIGVLWTEEKTVSMSKQSLSKKDSLHAYLWRHHFNSECQNHDSSCSDIPFERFSWKMPFLDSPLFFCHLLWSHQTLHPTWKRSLYFWRYFLIWWLSHHHLCWWLHWAWPHQPFSW